MGPNEKQKIEIDKLHWDPLPPLNQAVTADYIDFLGTALIPDKEVGLHAFRHGLATELANTNTPLPALQAQMRHADVRTTLRIYAHVVQQTQRDAMEGAAITTAIGTVVPIGTETDSQAVSKQ
jgi:integrase-like protein